MAQFYLLSILANIVAGLTLAGDYLGEKMPFLASFKNLRSNRAAQIVIALIAVVVGVIKLIVLSPGETVPVVGDILPALTGIVLGGILLIEAFRSTVDSRGESIQKISKTVLTYRVPVGIAGVAIALVHFLFPGAVIL
ncbi:MAG TPA: hypothetical protein VMV03_15205 [Spirochaetia bacterium]|nr:hypothetical protein [Spirochaetia bacterium]